MTRTKAQIKKDIEKFLRANGIMTLAVSLKDKPWVCTLYYGIDKKMNMYIVTDPNNKHGKIITKNQNVAFNIFDSHQKITKPKKGVQGAGRIELVRGLIQITKALILWHKANPGIEENIKVKDILKKITDTKIYKITPTYLKYFHKKLYSPEEYGIINLT